MTIEEIESTLKTGQVPPPELAEMRDWLSAYSSSMMDRQNEIIDVYADWYMLNKPLHKTDKATEVAWNTTDLGKEQRKLKTVQGRIKLLISTIASHLNVANNQARNLY